MKRVYHVENVKQANRKGWRWYGINENRRRNDEGENPVRVLSMRNEKEYKISSYSVPGGESRLYAQRETGEKDQNARDGWNG